MKLLQETLSLALRNGSDGVMISCKDAEKSEARKLLLENNISSFNYTEQDTFPTPNCRVQKKTKGRKRLDILQKAEAV